MNLSLLAGIGMFILSIGYLIMTLLLPDASIGKIPFEPKIFPTVLSILLLILSSGLIIREWLELQKQKAAGKPEKGFKVDQYLIKILIISGLAVVYALLFNRIGYVISTFLFLKGVLIVFNGWSNWKINTVVAVLFSVLVYVIFAKLLNVYLPVIPFLEI